MKYLILGVLFLLPYSSQAYNQETATYVAERAIEQGVNPALIVAVGICESDLRHKGVWGDNFKAYGIFQFWEKTFNWMSKQSSGSVLDWKSFEDQVDVAIWAFKNGYRSHWTCAKMYKNVTVLTEPAHKHLAMK